MVAIAIAAAGLVVAWAALVVVAQVLNPDQSPLAMGMSGLARGRRPWVMKSSFVARGLSALLLVAALPLQLPVAGLALVGVGLFWAWGVGSAALALADTDMPGEAPTSAGAAHTLIALIAYVAGVGGAIVLSVALLRDAGSSELGVWALSIAVTGAAALFVQFAAFGAAAREARAAAPAPRSAAPAVVPAPGSAAPAVVPAPAAPPASAASPPAPAGASPAGGTVAPPLGGAVPPQLGVAAGPPAAPASSAGRRSGSSILRDLAAYAGLYQRVFVGLLMAWTLLVALGLVAA